MVKTGPQEQDPEISGVEYQQGTLAGYEVRAYLLEKHNRYVHVLRQGGCPAPDRAHRPAELGQDGPSLESDPGVRAMQPSQGQPAR